MEFDYFRYYSRWHDYANKRRYAAPPDPWTLIHVDPSDISQWNMASLLWGLGRVRGGDWDQEERRHLTETDLFTGLKERYVEGMSWKETTYYEWGTEKLGDNEQFRGCSDMAEFVDKRCGALDEMVEDIRTNGYRPNYGHRYDSVADIEHVHEMEPIVLVDRDGEILLTEGFHRVILGQLLDIAAIPVYVLRRHHQWQQIRDSVGADGEIPSTIGRDGGRVTVDADSDHPDLQDVCGGEEITHPRAQN